VRLHEILRRYKLLLEPRARREFYALCALAVLAAFLEMLAVASIMPFLAALASPALVASDPRLATLHTLLGAGTQAEFLGYLGGIVLLVLVVANATAAATTWLLLRFANRQGVALSVRMLATYLVKPYEFYLGRHTAELQKNVFGEVFRVTGGIFIPTVQVVAKLSVAVLISILLVFVDPFLAAVVAGVLGTAYAGWSRWRARRRSSCSAGKRPFSTSSRCHRCAGRMRKPRPRRSASCRATPWKPSPSA
jgi:hypothetical protein